MRLTIALRGKRRRRKKRALRGIWTQYLQIRRPTFNHLNHHQNRGKFISFTMNGPTNFLTRFSKPASTTLISFNWSTSTCTSLSVILLTNMSILSPWCSNQIQGWEILSCWYLWPGHRYLEPTILLGLLTRIAALDSGRLRGAPATNSCAGVAGASAGTIGVRAGRFLDHSAA